MDYVSANDIINKQKKNLFIIFAGVYLFYLLIYSLLPLIFLIDTVGNIEGFFHAYLIGFFSTAILNYFLYIYLLIPSTIIRLIRGKQLSSMVTWIICIILFFAFTPWSVIASLAFDIPIFPASPFVPLMLPATIASYFVLKYPARED